MSQRRTSRRDEFWNDQPNWDDAAAANDAHRTRSHRQITRSTRIIPGFGATDPTPTSQSRMFDYESDDPDYSTGTVRPASAEIPAGGYAWQVTSTDDFDDDDDSGETRDESGGFGLGTYSSLAAGVPAEPIDDEFDDDAEIRPDDQRRRIGVDPLLLRLGIIIAVAVMAIPFAVSLGGGESSADGSDEIEPADTEAEETSTSVADADDTDGATTQTKSKAKTKPRKATSTTAAAVEASASNDSGDGGSDEGSSQQASAAAEPAVACGQEYQVIEGDYWTRLSDASGADLDNLLAANSATLDTPLYPDAVICLSQGAIRQPAPPTTTAPPTTQPPTTQPPATTAAPTPTEAPATTEAPAATTAAPATTEAPAATTAAPATTEAPAATTAAPATTEAPTATTEAPVTTQAPTTTEAPATTEKTSPPTTASPTTTPHTHAPPTTTPPATQTPPPPPTTNPPSPSGSVQDIIRSVWPDHLEERALVISYRESNWIPTAENYCCVGLFQIYYDVHKSWLAGIGINEKSDLYDPYLNAKAAYTLYQRSGGWGPWSQTNY